jgi:hypothetical protein
LLQNLDERKQAKLLELQDPSRINEDILNNVALCWAIVTMFVCSLCAAAHHTQIQIISTHFVRLAKPALARRLFSMSPSDRPYNFGTV